MKKTVLKIMAGLFSVGMLLSNGVTGKISLRTEAALSPIEATIKWAVDTANDNSHGYSQKYRWGRDYDCVSFVFSALREGGGYSVSKDTGTGNL